MKLTYRQVEGLLAELHGIREEGRLALQARVRHFQRYGWPGGTNTGRGRAATYDFGAVLGLCLGFELLQIGLTPERAVDVLRENWGYVRQATALAMRTDGIFIYCDPAALENLGKTILGEENSASDTFFFAGAGILREKLEQPQHIRRLAIINLSLILQLMKAHLETNGLPEGAFNKARRQWDISILAEEHGD
ncbi:hypothetical protein BSL82_05000 [Tardibacter chloracetimidivorans]|uniref:Uncharacterized protein n=1 Tax=Tardibacter chloracetimidivorans TaxID=1921510 RepID=A0A1L3ZSZ0_9SPHN|nr:hypothetical protein [Tardibacter chloracetimidivorans]API58752.1 hypothetical protein BSL82_05000 [Tardibacter chloracetimidivorans]